MLSKSTQQNALLSNSNISESCNNNNNMLEIKDKYNLIYFVCMLLGCGVLFAFQFLISAPDYFLSIVDNDIILILIQAIYIVPNAIASFIMISCGHSSSFTLQIVFMFILTSLAMISLPILVIIFDDVSLYKYLSVLCISGIIGMTTGILSASIIGFCNHLPIKYVQISICGQAIAGIIAGIIRISCIHIFDLKHNAGKQFQIGNIVYFAINGAFLLLCSILFFLIIKSSFIKYYLNNYDENKNIVNDSFQDKLQREILSAISGQCQHHKISSILTSKKFDDDDDNKNNLDIIDTTTTSINAGCINNSNENKIRNIQYQYIATYRNVWKKIKLLAISLFLVWFVTFLMLPGIIPILLGTKNGVYLILEFNICDYIGRKYFVSYTSCSFNKNRLWIGCIWRFTIYPMFLLMYYKTINVEMFVPIIFVAILGITHGLFCGLCFIMASSTVQLYEERICGSIMSTSLVIGITFGTYTALLIHYVTQHSLT